MRSRRSGGSSIGAILLQQAALAAVLSAAAEATPQPPVERAVSAEAGNGSGGGGSSGGGITYLKLEGDFDDLAVARSFSASPCGGILTQMFVGQSGSIKSPNYPADYPAGASCLWRFEGPAESSVSITCDDVLTQKCDGAKNLIDYILINPNPPDNKYYVICGYYKKPFTLNSFSNILEVYFRSSSSDNYRGFHCRWQVTSNATKATTTTSTTTSTLATTTVTTTTSSTTTPIATTTSEPAPTTTEEDADETTTVEPAYYNGEPGCGVSAASTTRIVGGSETLPHEFPWAVGLSFNLKWFCGGTIIAKQWILTAAHCTDTANFAYLYIGVHNIYANEDGRLVLYSETFFEHPSYIGSLDKLQFDVALVKIPMPLSYTAAISPVCLPLRSQTDLGDWVNLQMTTCGWGVTMNGSSSINPTLNKVQMKVISNDACKANYGSRILPTNICATGVNDAMGTCQGDSGGPLQQRLSSSVYVQIGVVSFGSDKGCGSKNPNGFSRLSYFLDFITNVTGIEYD